MPRAWENPAEERASRGRSVPKPAPEWNMTNSRPGYSDRRTPAGVQRVSGAVCPQHVRRSRASRWPLSTRRRATWHPGFPTSRTTSRTITHNYSWQMKWYQHAGAISSGDSWKWRTIQALRCRHPVSPKMRGRGQWHRLQARTWEIRNCESMKGHLNVTQ